MFIWLWYRLRENQAQKEEQAEYRHNADIPTGVNYFGKYYIVRHGVSVLAFSTTCTHAGCRLGKTNSNVLQCSCHGSQFDAETGKPLKGPAIRPLQQLDCQFDPKAGQWIVKLQPRMGANLQTGN